MSRFCSVPVGFALFCLVLLFRRTASSTPSVCGEKSTCDSCIGVFGCTWCKELKGPFLKFQRCNTLQGHRSNKCPPADIVRAESGQPKIESMRIQPQGVDVKLAVGQEITVELSYNDSSDKPLDLYYIMDLSATMKDDKITVSKQAYNLVDELRKITKDVRLGFGSFIDKPLLPFVSSSHLRQDNEFEIPYGFKNSLSLTDDIGQFGTIVKNAKISRNLDEPEGTLDALMQAITCKEEIGWRNTSRKLIVVATDGPFHIAGDGKLGGIVHPNDLKCHMENNMYTHSTLIDYPSIGEINAAILDHKVYVIFAASTLEGDQVFKVYNELQNHITQSTAERLNVDFSNVVQKIKSKYLEISSTVRLTIEEAPHFVDVVVLAKCSSAGGYAPQQHCNNVGVGTKISFRIKLKLKECPDPRQNRNFKNQVVISFFELTAKEKLVIDLRYACNCPCNDERNQDPNTLANYCNGVDAAKYTSCGVCTCKDGRYGQSCQCSVTNEFDQGNRTNCVNPRGDSQVECSNRGECKCGQCDCPRDYNGDYCEDSTLECQNPNGQFKDRICSDNGQCQGGKCVCVPAYEGKYCECEKSKKISCVEPGQPIDNICNGHGTCDCGGAGAAQCKCNSDYSGIYCGVCKINCPASGDQLQSRCQDKILQQCVRCRIRLHYDKKNYLCVQQCDWQKVLEEMRKGGDGKKRSDVGEYEFLELSPRSGQTLSDKIGKECRVAINSSCTSKFKYTYEKGSQNDILKVYYSPQEVNCAVEPPVIWYIFGVILSVLLAGIFGLLIWKLATHLHDTREYKKFETERAQAKWHGGENPLYNKPMSEFQNPAYRD